MSIMYTTVFVIAIVSYIDTSQWILAQFVAGIVVAKLTYPIQLAS